MSLKIKEKFNKRGILTGAFSYALGAIWGLFNFKGLVKMLDENKMFGSNVLSADTDGTGKEILSGGAIG
ncbi:hypothetical protein D3C76_1406370 [compost metagenome]